jgi:hypothetical protein
MSPVAWLDDFGKPAWIAVTIVSFVLAWPLGLVVLGFLIGSGRMGCWTSRRGGGGGDWRSGMERMQQRAAQWCGPRAPGMPGQRMSPGAGGSGNRAFDEYREETLRRLEEEERQFKEYLDRLRHAKDKAEFDQFMAEMRRRPDTGPAPQPGV